MRLFLKNATLKKSYGSRAMASWVKLVITEPAYVSNRSFVYMSHWYESYSIWILCVFCSRYNNNLTPVSEMKSWYRSFVSRDCIDSVTINKLRQYNACQRLRYFKRRRYCRNNLNNAFRMFARFFAHSHSVFSRSNACAVHFPAYIDTSARNMLFHGISTSPSLFFQFSQQTHRYGHGIISYLVLSLTLRISSKRFFKRGTEVARNRISRNSWIAWSIF